MSADTSASVRPGQGDVAALELGRDPVGGGSAAARRAATSSGSFRARRGPVTSEARRHRVPPAWPAWRSTTNRAQVRSPMATVPAGADEVGDQGHRVVRPRPTVPGRTRPGRSTTRGASRRGTTRVASPSRGTTSMVSRSRGMAS